MLRSVKMHFQDGRLGCRSARGLIVFFLLNLPITAKAQYTFTTNCPDTNTVTITGYTGDGGDIVIPSTLADKTVTGIGTNSFHQCISLTSVAMSDSIDNIGDSAFRSCSNLCGIVLGNGITNIGAYAFFQCINLPDIAIPEGVTSIGRAAFQYCNSLTNVTIPCHVASIGDLLFYSCASLTNVTIPDGVANIGASAFYACYNLASIAIPASVTSIGEMAFRYCVGLTDVKVPDSVTSIGSQAFYACTSLTNIAIGTSVTNIGGLAFVECDRLCSITIPDRVASIGMSVFQECYHLTNVVIGCGVTSIGDYAFNYCTGLAQIYFRGNAPSNVNEAAFYNSSVTIYHLPGTFGWPTVPGLWAGCPTALWLPPPLAITPSSMNFTSARATGQFIDVTASTSWSAASNAAWIAITAGHAGASNGTVTFNVATNAGTSFRTGAVIVTGGGVSLTCTVTQAKAAEAPYTYATNFLDTNTITITGYTGAGGAEVIPSNIMGRTVTVIGNSAFESCGNLTGISIPASVVRIEDFAFICCGLTNVVIPDSVTNMGNIVFGGCGALIDVVIGSGVTHIGNSAFEACGSLASIAIPAGVASIGSSAFSFCSGMTNITFDDGVIDIADLAFLNCSQLASIMIPESVTNIGNWAFGSCGSLTSVVIGSGVARIGNYALNDCTNLSGVYFRGNAPAVGAAVFSNVPATVFHLPGTPGWPTVPGLWAGRPTALWLPGATADGNSCIQDGQFRFSIGWASGRTVVVDVCTNLADPVWIPLQTITLPSDRCFFSDPDWASVPDRFYRLREP